MKYVTNCHRFLYNNGYGGTNFWKYKAVSTLVCINGVIEMRIHNENQLHGFPGSWRIAVIDNKNVSPGASCNMLGPIWKKYGKDGIINPDNNII